MSFLLMKLSALALLLLGVLAAPVTVTNGTQFRDTAGNVLHAHGGGVLKVGGYYYWFGEHRNPDNTFRAVSVYRSTDLLTWEFRNNVLTQSSHAELNVANIERPKVIYNSATGRYVMWMHKENGSNYSEARAAVASSATVDGSLHLSRQLPPAGPHVARHHALQRQRHRLHDLGGGRDPRPAHLPADGGLSERQHAGGQLLERRPPRGPGDVQARRHLLPADVRGDGVEPEPGEVRDRVEHLRPVDGLDQRRRRHDVQLPARFRAARPGLGDHELPVHG
ncbi:hypothetical protein HD593_008170 [Nonomuraea rubra]|uniref:Glycosyl hydrolases family 43 n=1 Tax=Nonomuraea rubra TaxID=46180 RepID=A0A7X0P174_9ACTN|nr:hypothetical protein [Nonomuraea rubra]MBB6553375.1 hypothetical protein [Nonomuraea rubra]